MDGYDSATYGDRIADIYDSSVELPADTGEAAAFLAGRHRRGGGLPRRARRVRPGAGANAVECGVADLDTHRSDLRAS